MPKQTKLKDTPLKLKTEPGQHIYDTFVGILEQDLKAIAKSMKQNNMDEVQMLVHLSNIKLSAMGQIANVANDIDLKWWNYHLTTAQAQKKGQTVH